MRKRKKEEPENRTFREKVAQSLDMAKDIILDVPKIELLGNREAVVENYKGIVEYTPEKIVLEANPREIRICGRNLEIRSVAQELLLIVGMIDSIGFVKER